MIVRDSVANPDLDEIGDIFVNEFDAPVEVLTANVGDDGVVYGNLLSAGDFHHYAFDEYQIGFEFDPTLTNDLHEYSQGLMSAYGIHADTANAYDYGLGLLRVDAQVRCTKGGKPCGGICLPQGKVCRKNGASGGAANVKAKLKNNQPNFGGKLDPGTIAAGLATGAGVGAARMAGKAAVEYGAKKANEYIEGNKDLKSKKEKLQRGANVVAERVKRAATEGGAEVAKGVEAAKTRLAKGMGSEAGVKASASAKRAGEAVGRNLQKAGKAVERTAKSVNRKGKDKPAKSVESKVAKESDPQPKKLAEEMSPGMETLGKAIVETTNAAATAAKRKRGRPKKNPD